MKKVTKSLMTLTLVIILCVSLVGTAFASESAWRAFPTQKVSSYTNHAYAVQAIMYRYSSSTRSTLTSNGYYIGVDANYGSLTEAAVKIYQREMGITPVDGIVGSITWPALWNSLVRVSSSGAYTYYKVGSGYTSATAISRRYEPVTGAVVTGWYAYNDYGNAIFFAN